MTEPIYSLDGSIPGHGKRRVTGTQLEPAVAQLIDLSERQSQHRRKASNAETLELPPANELPRTIGSTKVAPQPRPRTPWIGAVLLLTALGVLAQAWVGYQGRITGSFSSSLWYLSLCLIYVPSATLIMSRRLTEQARIWLTLYMSLALLASELVLYPTQFTYHDELINYRVLLSIESSGHLFTPNSLLPAASDYPGGEIATSAIHQLTGLSLHSAGIVMLVAVRIVMTLALIRIIQRIAKSATVGCLAALIYATNPQYVFFNSQFAYQSFALPLCFFCIYIFTLHRSPRRLVAVAPSAMVVVAVAATHHLTSLALVVVLSIWYLFTRITGRPVAQLLPLAILSMMIVAARAWLARSAIGPYIAEIAHNVIRNIVDLANGEANHRFFTDHAGDRTPAWQAALAVASVIIIISTLLPAVWLAIIKHRLLNAAALVLLTIAAIYPMIPAGHFTNVTGEVSDRAAGFVFVGIGYLVATWWFRDVPFHRHARTGRFTVARNTWLLILGLTVCFVGGTVSGSGPDWLHGPGGYLVSADNRSVDQLALQAAYWEGWNLPANSRVYTDRINSLLATDYGNQHALTSIGDGINTQSLSTLLLSPPSPSDVSFACQANVEYLIADKRLSSSLPHVSVYIESGEYPPGVRTSPPAVSALTKFDEIGGAQRIFDNGALRIYDLRGLPCAGRK